MPFFHCRSFSLWWLLASISHFFTAAIKVSCLSSSVIGGFHVMSSPPCWWTVNKRSLINSLCLSTSIWSFDHCYFFVSPENAWKPPIGFKQSKSFKTAVITARSLVSMSVCENDKTFPLGTGLVIICLTKTSRGHWFQSLVDKLRVKDAVHTRFLADSSTMTSTSGQKVHLDASPSHPIVSSRHVASASCQLVISCSHFVVS